MSEYFIGLDVHQAFTEMAMVTGTGRLARRERCETKIRALVRILESIRRLRRLAKPNHN